MITDELHEPMIKPRFIIGNYKFWFYRMPHPKTSIFRLLHGWRIELRGFVFMFGK